MQIKLYRSATVGIIFDSGKILCDPWFFGHSFNEGWRLSLEPTLKNFNISGVTGRETGRNIIELCYAYGGYERALMPPQNVGTRTFKISS